MSRVLRSCAPILCVLVPAVAWTEDGAPDARKTALTAEDLVGSYRIVEAQKHGLKTPKEKIDGMIVRFTEDTIVGTDKDKQDVYSASFKLDTSKSPAVIVMTSTLPNSKGTVAHGLVEQDGETVRLIYTLPKELGGGDAPAPPRDFTCKKGQVLTVIRKISEPY